MEIRKYLFWMRQDGIQTYEMTKEGKYNLVFFKGEEVFDGSDIVKYIQWFEKYLSLTEDEYIDFCYLSEHRLESPLFDYKRKEQSSWSKEELKQFCSEYMEIENYRIVLSDEKNFICQNGNLMDTHDLKNIYVKCTPEFFLSTDSSEEQERKTEETSLLSRYFLDMLKELNS